MRGHFVQTDFIERAGLDSQIQTVPERLSLSLLQMTQLSCSQNQQDEDAALLTVVLTASEAERQIVCFCCCCFPPIFIDKQHLYIYKYIYVYDLYVLFERFLLRAGLNRQF